MKDPLVKVCGITRQEDADLAASLGVHLLGFIFHPESPRFVPPEHVRRIRTTGTMRVGVFVKQTPAEILDIMQRAQLHIAQLHGGQDEAFCEQLGKMHVMKVFWPQRYGSREKLEDDLKRFAHCSRFYLLDAGLEGGGSGEHIDFAFLNGLSSPKTWFLAGGLGPHNIDAALAACHPCGVDLNSRVESAPGVKDHTLLREALRSILR
ncbi:MAG: phosphoribosylanthranilate isomerase [Desulfovibrionaceae bacterium]